MPQIQLFGGEKDGTVMKLSNKTTRPDIFYAVPSEDEDLIKETSGAKAKVELRQKLSVLAYSYQKTVSRTGVGTEYQYIRCPELDKADPVDRG